MKTIGILALTLICFGQLAHGQISDVICQNPYLDGRTYTFRLTDAELDQSPDWNGDDSPPLTVNRAVTSAKDYLSTLPTRHPMTWTLDDVHLRKIGTYKDKWIYTVRFHERPQKDYNGPVYYFQIIVYMTGNIVEPEVTERNSQP